MIGEDRIERELLEYRAPGADGAEERTWNVVRAAFDSECDEVTRTASKRRHRSRMTMLLGTVGATAAILGLTLTPAGAAVSEWVRTAIGGSATTTQERPALTHVPSGGRLLVAAGSGQWLVAEDGSRRFLGDFGSAAWSPGGLFVAAADGDTLVALSPDGEGQWSVPAPGGVEDPTWAPGCCRIAYRSGGGLWVVDGAGNFNHRLVPNIAAVAPSWRPARYDLEMQGSRNAIAYIDAEDRLRVVDVDSGKRLADIGLAERPTSIDWLSRSRILLAMPDRIEVVDLSGGGPEVIYRPGAGEIHGADAQPGVPQAAVLVTREPGAAGKADTRLVLVDVRPGRGNRPRTTFSGLGHYQGPVFSPDGSRVQLGWRDAGQWIFVPVRRGRTNPIAVDNISHQFDSGSGSEQPLPQIESWCCR
jgi:hypothetical protein